MSELIGRKERHRTATFGPKLWHCVAVIGLILIAAHPRVLLSDEFDADPIDDLASTISRTNVIASFSVSRNGHYLLLPVSIDGRLYRFMLDTGASSTFVDLTLADKLKPTDETVAVNNRGLNRIYEAPNAFVGKPWLALERRVIATDLSAIRNSSGTDFDGFLGMNFLRHYIADIDFDKGKVSFLVASPDGDAAAIPLGYDGAGCPTVNVNYGNGKTAAFQIDTGFAGGPGVLIERGSFDGLVADRHMELVDSQSIEQTVHGSFRVRTAQLKQVSFGGYRSDDVLVREGMALGNVLALNYLARFRLTFDFPNKRLFVKPGRGFLDPHPVTATGMHLSRNDGKLVITRIRSGSDATAAGLEPGDCLVSIDGKRLDGMTVDDVQGELSFAGREYEVLVEREGKQLSLRLAIRGIGKPK